MSALPFALPVERKERDICWERSRNGLGIARLLSRERRAPALVEAACHMAVEYACRAALAQQDLSFDGDLQRAWARLAAPHDLWPAPAPDPLPAAESAIGWVAAYLRSEAPERAWGF